MARSTITNILPACLALVLATVAISCSIPIAAPPTTGSVSLSVTEQMDSLLDIQHELVRDIHAFRITLRGADTTQTVIIPASDPANGLSDVTIGDWNVSVEGLNREDVVIAKGSSTITVVGGETARSLVTVEPFVFRTRWEIHENETLQLPLLPAGQYDFYINWGDRSSIERITTHDAGTHTYSAAGEYTITIWGLIEGFQTPFPEGLGSLVAVMQWGPLLLGNSGGYFQLVPNLAITATDAPNLENTTNLRSMFSGTILTGDPDLSAWDVSGVTNMSGMFNISGFDGNIRTWDVSNVTDMSYMFQFNPVFNQDLTNWCVRNIDSVPDSFTTNESKLHVTNHPKWGTCPER